MAPRSGNRSSRTKAICKERWETWAAEQAELEKQAELERFETAEEERIAAKLGHFPEAETLFKDAFQEWLRLYKSPPTRKRSEEHTSELQSH